MSINLAQAIEKVAERASTEVFVESFIREDNYEDRKEEGLGVAISKWAKWDGETIMRVFIAALEDANFHEEAGRVSDILKQMEY